MRFPRGVASMKVWYWLAFLREPQRVVSTGLAVMLGVTALILSDGFIDRCLHLFREDIIRAHYAHIQVRPADPVASVLPAQARANVIGAVGRELEAVPGTLVAQRRSFGGLIALGDRTVGFLGEGVEPAIEARLSSALRISDGSGLEIAAGPGVLLGEGLARSIGAKTGSRVTLIVNLPGGGVNALETPVVGIFYSATKAYDDRALRIPLTQAQALLRDKGVSRLMILLPDTDDAPRLAARLKAVLRAEPVEVRTWLEMADFYTKTRDLFARQLSFLRLIVLGILLLSIGSGMSRNVLDRYREIGTMMALGATRSQVGVKFAVETLIVGLLFGAIGVTIGALLAGVISAIGIPMPPPPGTAHGFTAGISFSAGNALSALTLVGVACALACVPSVIRASRVQIVDALRQ